MLDGYVNYIHLFYSIIFLKRYVFLTSTLLVSHSFSWSNVSGCHVNVALTFCTTFLYKVNKRVCKV